MKKFTHALIACKAVERLQTVELSDKNKPFADELLEWFKAHKDNVIQGTWYPDKVICDMSTSHIYKYTPVGATVEGLSAGVTHESLLPSVFRNLPATSLQFAIGRKSPLCALPFTVDPGTNLPDRCEALSHSVIDNLRIREAEPEGSPLLPTDDHIALVLFMLSHYVADAHMPMHCDSRKDSFLGFNVHAEAEDRWNREVVRYYRVSIQNQCFTMDEQSGFPKLFPDEKYEESVLFAVDKKLASRPFQVGYGSGNDNVREYVLAISQYSYLNSYAWLPYGLTGAQFDRETLQAPGGLPFNEMSIAALADAIDAVARVWLHDLRRFVKWKEALEA